MPRRVAGLSSLLVALSGPGCRPAPPAAVEPALPSGEASASAATPAPTGLSDPTRAYREMGFLAQGPPVAFVGAVRFLAGPNSDSTLALLTLSLANRSLTFQRAGARFQAAYRVEAVFRSGAATRQIASDQAVRVGSFAETQRTDESVIFQHFMLLPPGEGLVEVTVRDQVKDVSSHEEQTLRVPRFDHPSVSSIVASYRTGGGRADRKGKPDVLANPRATVPFESDTLTLYLEVYGDPVEGSLTLRAMDDQHEVWRSVPALQGDSALRVAIVQLPPGLLPPGRLRIEGILAGAPDTVRTPVLTSFADQWMLANFEGVLDLLRYFGNADAIRQLRASADSNRATLWRQFWQNTDPNAATPENEALARYFGRLRAANAEFREGNQPGWLTDRGEVFITLGKPDEEFQARSDFPTARDPKDCRINCPSFGWRYTGKAIVLIFVFDPGLGRYRLDPSSRREFQRRYPGGFQG